MYFGVCFKILTLTQLRLTDPFEIGNCFYFTHRQRSDISSMFLVFHIHNCESGESI